MLTGCWPSAQSYQVSKPTTPPQPADCHSMMFYYGTLVGSLQELLCKCVSVLSLSAFFAHHQAVQSSKGGVKVVRPMWIAKMAAAPKLGGWQLTGVGKDQGTYGAVVIAHNGKCANRWVCKHSTTQHKPTMCTYQVRVQVVERSQEL